MIGYCLVAFLAGVAVGFWLADMIIRDLRRQGRLLCSRCGDEG